MKNGKSLLTDINHLAADKLTDLDLLYDMLLDVPDLIDLTPITAPQILRWDAPQCRDKMDWGYTGMVIFSESHMSFHTWPEKGLINIDITSCKDFNEKFVIDYLADIFEASRMYFTYSIVRRY